MHNIQIKKKKKKKYHGLLDLQIEGFDIIYCLSVWHLLKKKRDRDRC